MVKRLNYNNEKITCLFEILGIKPKWNSWEKLCLTIKIFKN